MNPEERIPKRPVTCQTFPKAIYRNFSPLGQEKKGRGFNAYLLAALFYMPVWFNA